MKNKIERFENRSVFGITKLNQYFSKAPNTVISDIGAGYGHMEETVNSISGIWQPFDYVKKIDKSIHWDLNFTAPKDVKKPGIVILLEVLEHLPNPLQSLQNISDHMEKDGYMILSTPNPQSSKNIINLILKGTLYAFQEKHIKEYHVFTPWEHIVREFLKTAGFEILEYAIVDTSYQNRKAENYKDYFKLILERILEKRNKKATGMSYGIVAKKIV
ncbi:class I SAM-dependent methyltransferase [Olleya sp. ITB9]|uniref:class I SAM-dependent methyltransferase n=1 Tax=Olleya sp. ITB9 TaxID=1715648 RepID=UPI0006D11E40|nr:class I SAM-dependent methyltransferase [Olleya sp. ITB9]